MIAADVVIKVPPDAPPAFLVFDIETVPDGELLKRVKYSREDITPEEAIRRAQAEARENSYSGSDFLPVPYHRPVAICVLRVNKDFAIQSLTCLDAPEFRTRAMVEGFWKGVEHHTKAKLVTYNGRGFDLPVLELMAFRYGVTAQDYFVNRRNRYNGGHIDLMDFLNNFGASRLPGGLNLLAKVLDRPGKMDIAGDQVCALYQAGKLQEINDYCAFDTLDTYFTFLRTRVMIGEFSRDREHHLLQQAHAWLTEKSQTMPALQQYLQNCGEGPADAIPSATGEPVSPTIDRL